MYLVASDIEKYQSSDTKTKGHKLENSSNPIDIADVPRIIQYGQPVGSEGCLCLLQRKKIRPTK
jgi:hypothetical protein